MQDFFTRSTVMNFKFSGKSIRIVFTALTMVFCNTGIFASDTAPVIILYGNEKCGYCRETMQWLDNQKITYVYRDVESYGTFQEEMFAKIEKAGFTTTAYFPVLDINGQILMKPKFDDIQRALSGQKVSDHGEKKIRGNLWRPQKNKSLKTDFASVRKTLTASDIIIYDDGSGSGKPLLKKLKNEQIAFTLKQLNKLNNAAYFDMSSRLSSLGYGNATLFPVVEVRGEMIMNPSIEDVKILVIEMTAE